MPKLRLSARNVLTLPAAPGGRRRVYTDETLPGFVLRVMPSGVRTYAVRYGERGDKAVTIGDARVMALSDARDEAREILGRVAKGEDPALQKAEARKREAEQTDTFEALAERLIEHADLGERTRYVWRSLLAVHVYPKIGALPPAEVTRATLRDLIGRIAEAAPVSANDALKVVRWVYARAVERDLVGTSPCVGLRKPTKERPRDRTATNEELRLLWNACTEHGLYGAAVRLALLTAARREEVFSARWPELDPEAGVWKIPGARTKNARAHEVPLVATARELLDETRARTEPVGEWIFPGRQDGKALRPAFKSWRRLLSSAGLEDAGLRFHDLRRSVRDRLTRDLDVSVPVAEACIGHAPPRLIATYAPSGVALKDKRLAFSRWERELLSIVNPAAAAEKLARMPERA